MNWMWILWGILTAGVTVGTLMFWIKGNDNEELLGWVAYITLIMGFLISTGLNLGLIG